VHSFNGGITGSGKTYHAIQYARGLNVPCIFVNPQQEDIRGFIRADGSNSLQQVKRALKDNKKINYIPDMDKKKSVIEIDYLVKTLCELGKKTLFVCDECDIWAGQGVSTSPLFFVAQRGRKWGIEGLFISQSPSEVDKIILKNCEIQRVFRFNEFGEKYYRGYGYDTDKMRKMLEQKGEYSYILLENGAIKGAFKE